MNDKKQKVILLVEDDPMIMMFESITIKKYGFNVISVNTGEKAIEEVDKNTSIDLILMDINLGSGIDGTEAAEIILKKYDLPLIFLSSHTEPEVVEKTEGITSYGYIDKSSGETVLIASIKMAFRLFEAKMKEKEKEEALMLSETRLSSFINSAEDSFYLLDSNLNFIEINKKGLEIIGKKKEEVLGKNIADIVPDVKTSGRYERHLEVIKTGKPFEIVKFVPHPVFGDRHFIMKSFKVGDGLGVIAHDITERVKMENKIRESEATLFQITNAIPVFVSIVNTDLEYQFVNKNYEDFFKLSKDKIIGKKIKDIIGDEAFKISYPNIMKALKGQNITFDNKIKNENELEWIIQTTYIPFYKNNTIEGLIILAINITERKHNEELIKKNEELLRVQFEKSPDIILMINRDYSIIAINRPVSELYTIDEIIGKNAIDILPEEHHEIIKQTVDKCFNTGTIQEIDHKISMGKWFHGRIIPIFEGDIVTRILIISSDITKQKQIEDNLIKTTTLLEESFKQSPVPMVLVSMPDTIIKIVNPACIEFLGIIDEPSYAGTSLLNFIPTYKDYDSKGNAGLVKDLPLARALRGEKTINEERQIVRKDGTTRWELVNSTPIIDNQGNIIAGYLVMMDITEQKLAEEKIKYLLQEKELILKEVHHRIKNNITSVENFLTIQSQTIENPDAVPVILDAISRVKSMRLLYDNLLLTEDYKEISVKSYLNNLIDTIVELFKKNILVTVEKHLDDFTLNSKVLFPIGIIVNELFTNILKYAFINRDKGLIKISLLKNDNHIKLSIIDDGIGLPENFNIDSTKTFGIILVKMLSQQMDGSFKIESNQGTGCYLEFDI